jgi:hypothetical protein
MSRVDLGAHNPVGVAACAGAGLLLGGLLSPFGVLVLLPVHRDHRRRRRHDRHDQRTSRRPGFGHRAPFEHRTVHSGHSNDLACRIPAGHGLASGAPPGTRTPNPRIKRPKFTHSRYDYLRLCEPVEATRWAPRAVRDSDCWTRAWTAGPLWTEARRRIKRALALGGRSASPTCPLEAHASRSRSQGRRGQRRRRPGRARRRRPRAGVRRRDRRRQVAARPRSSAVICPASSASCRSIRPRAGTSRTGWRCGRPSCVARAPA